MIYFNNAAESYPKPLAIKEVVNDLPYYENGRNCNCNRDDDLSTQLRNKLLKFLNVPNTFQVTLTNSSTESANLVIRSLARSHKPFGYLSNSHNCIVRTCHNVDSKSKMIGAGIINGCKTICINHQSNVDGKVFDVTRQISLIKEESKHFLDEDKPRIVIDISQSIGNIEIDVSKWNYEYLYIFGTFHKNMGSICGCGFLIHPIEKNDLVPLITGGTGYESTRISQPLTYPFYLESGSKNSLAIACAVKSIDITNGFIESNHQIKLELAKYFKDSWEEKANESTKHYFYCNYVEDTSFINLIPPGSYIGETVGLELENTYHIITRFGYHCCPFYSLNTSYEGYKHQGTIRLSFGIFNTKEEIDCFYESLNDICFKLYAKERKNSK